MKGGPVLPGSPLESKPTWLNILGSTTSAFFVAPRVLAPVRKPLDIRSIVMKKQKPILWIAAGATLLSLFGCDVFVADRPHRERVYVEQQPVYVAPVRQTVIVEQAPPPVVVEVRIR